MHLAVWKDSFKVALVFTLYIIRDVAGVHWTNPPDQTGQTERDNICSYGSDWAKLFPAMAEGRTGQGQAGAQLATIAITLVISGLGGLATGLVIRAAGLAQSR